ncbi:DUF1010 domain-containing protein [Simplicispira suum]|uniref:DUF1010 domain-containing protein n=1 Tax=Simplicispira suum TaxID=2109915 RepID=UPI0014746E9F
MNDDDQPFVSRSFSVFSASSACTYCVGSYCFVSIAPLVWQSVFSSGSLVVKLWRSVVVAMRHSVVK